MTAGEAVQGALVAALAGHAALSDAINGVFVGRPVRASPPYALVDEPIAIDWSTKTERGRELRIAVTIHDVGEAPARLNALIGEAETAIETMPRELGGWRVASLVFVRSRVARDGQEWIGAVEYRVRVMETE